MPVDAFFILSKGKLLLSKHFNHGVVAGIDGQAAALEAEVLRTLAGGGSSGAGVLPGRWSCFGFGEAFVVYSGQGAGLVFVVVGSGDDDELALYEVGKALVEVTSEHCGGRLDEDHLREFFGKVSLAVDEMISYGFVEVLDKDTVMRQSKLKPFKS
eukprot:g1441.t1